MELPDKIYLASVEPRLNGYAGIAWTDAEDIIEPIEYIRKDALLEWLEQELAQRQQWLDRYGEGEDLHAATELKKVIDKINSL